MRVLVIGGGGREHALAWKIQQSPKLTKLICAPGNAGTALVAQNMAVAADDIPGLLKLCRKEEIDLAVVGPEGPLVAGVADKLREAGVRVVGPGAKGAQLEGSKVFAKTMMQKYVIPTAPWQSFTDLASIDAYLESQRHFPVVLKADGLAAGKGVVLAQDLDEAFAEASAMLEEGRFGEAGKTVLVEECLRGEEMSVLAFTDGHTIVMLETSQDYKRALDGDLGPNTGGMGALSPTPVATDKVMDQVTEDVLVRIVHGLARQRIEYRGVLYAGIMVTRSGAKVLEFNCRMGDPETQVVLARLKSDLLPVLEAVADGRIQDLAPLEWDPRPAVCVVMASRGYPASSSKGDVITGLDAASDLEDVFVFHAGTDRDGDDVLTAGGRVLGVTALGDTVEAARTRAYEAVSRIQFDGMLYRTDIAR